MNPIVKGPVRGLFGLQVLSAFGSAVKHSHESPRQHAKYESRITRTTRLTGDIRALLWYRRALDPLIFHSTLGSVTWLTCPDLEARQRSPTSQKITKSKMREVVDVRTVAEIVTSLPWDDE